MYSNLIESLNFLSRSNLAIFGKRHSADRGETSWPRSREQLSKSTQRLFRQKRGCDPVRGLRLLIEPRDFTSKFKVFCAKRAN